MRYSEIVQNNKIVNFSIPTCDTSKEVIEEIHIINNTFDDNRTDFTIYTNGAKLLPQEKYTYVNNFPENKITVYYIGTKTEVYCYVGILEYDSNNWLMNLWTTPKHRNKGYAAQIIQTAIRQKGPLLVDISLTSASASLIEKMITSKIISASIVDFDTRTTVGYSPDLHKNHPMYDKKIDGIDRPVLSKQNARRFTWLIEHAFPRWSPLSPFVEVNERLKLPKKNLNIRYLTGLLNSGL